MPPQLVLLFGFGLIAWLFRQEMRVRRLDSRAILIPIIWIAIQGSRPVSYWVGSGGGLGARDGHPVNTILYGLLILSALVVLSRRRIDWGEIIRDNRALFLIYGFFALSAIWSEAPFVSGKRLVKDFGSVLMVLIVLTEVNPSEAIRTVVLRLSFILFPLSVIFGKWFPGIGRNYSLGGEPMFTGITMQKNALGQLTFIFMLVIIWDLMESRREERLGDPPLGRKQFYIRGLMLVMGFWLLIASSSQTSLLCFLIGIGALWATGWLTRMQSGKTLLVIGLIGVLLIVGLDDVLGFSDIIIRALGRDPSLTGRTDIWETVLSNQNNPLYGNGFNVWWDSAQRWTLVDKLSNLKTAHSGYVDILVDGGYIGMLLLIGLLLASGARVIGRLFDGVTFRQLGFVIWCVAVVYNFSESSFFRLDLLWLMFLLATVEVSRRYGLPGQAGPGMATTPDEPRFRSSRDDWTQSV